MAAVETRVGSPGFELPIEIGYMFRTLGKVAYQGERPRRDGAAWSQSLALWDKLRRKDKSEQAKERSEASRDNVRGWTDALFKRLQPDQLRLQPGETVGEAITRILNLEEQRVHESNEGAELERMKLEGLAHLRREFGLASAPGSSPIALGASSERERKPKEGTMSEGSEARPAEATYDMVMGGLEELKGVPITHFMQLVQIWAQIVKIVGPQERMGEALLKEYQPVRVVIEQGEKEPELVAQFHGSRAMVHTFLAKLREAGLVSS